MNFSPRRHSAAAEALIHVNDEEKMTNSINLAVQKNDPMECSNSSVAIAFQSAEKASVSMHSLGQRKIRLSKSHLEQGDISLLPIDDFFSTEVVGGWDSDNAASRMLTAIFDGQAFETDIDGSQWTLRDRRSLVDYLALFEAKIGDELVIDRIALHVYAFRIKAQAATPPAITI
jgi:hypothetical protein